MNRSDQLTKFLDLLNDKVRFNSVEERFNSLTNLLMNYFFLAVGKNTYRITECEIYYMDQDHSDPYVHGEQEQLTTGHLYLNKVGGLDITFGNPDIPVFAGILIRGIRNLKTNEYISQVQKIVSEIFNALGNILTEENGIYLREGTPGQIKTEEPIRTTRVGLTKSEADTDDYILKPYRYIVELNSAHKFKDRAKVVKQLLSESKIAKGAAKDILGYAIN